MLEKKGLNPLLTRIHSIIQHLFHRAGCCHLLTVDHVTVNLERRLLGIQLAIKSDKCETMARKAAQKNSEKCRKMLERKWDAVVIYNVVFSSGRRRYLYAINPMG